MSTGCGNKGRAFPPANGTASTDCGNIRSLLDAPCDGLMRVRMPAELVEIATRRAGERGMGISSYARRAVVAALVADEIRDRAAAARAVSTKELFSGDSE